jgi:hypothetical protein
MAARMAPRRRTRADPALIKAVARAHRWKRLLESGRYASLSKLAAVEKIDHPYVGKMLRLTLLALNIDMVVLDGRHPEGLQLPTWGAAGPISPTRGTAFRDRRDIPGKRSVHGCAGDPHQLGDPGQRGA